MEKIDHSCMIQCIYLKGPTNNKAKLDSTLEESTCSFTIMKYWVSVCKRGGISCQDENCCGGPNEVGYHTRNGEENPQNGMKWSSTENA